jgi:hypothetical protein
MRSAIGVFATIAAMGLTSAAGAITTDGDWSDWFTYTGNVGFNTWDENLVILNSINIRTQVDEEGPTPGGGGQTYDIEQIFYIFEDADLNVLSGGVLHIGLVTGYPPDGRPADDLFAGDMFVDFGNTGSYSLAIATSTSTIKRWNRQLGHSGSNLFQLLRSLACRTECVHRELLLNQRCLGPGGRPLFS